MKINPKDAGSGSNRLPGGKGLKGWKEYDVIEEDGLLEDGEGRGENPFLGGAMFLYLFLCFSCFSHCLPFVGCCQTSEAKDRHEDYFNFV